MLTERTAQPQETGASERRLGPSRRSGFRQWPPCLHCLCTPEAI